MDQQQHKDPQSNGMSEGNRQTGLRRTSGPKPYYPGEHRPHRCLNQDSACEQNRQSEAFKARVELVDHDDPCPRRREPPFIADEQRNGQRNQFWCIGGRAAADRTAGVSAGADCVSARSQRCFSEQVLR